MVTNDSQSVRQLSVASSRLKNKSSQGFTRITQTRQRQEQPRIARRREWFPCTSPTFANVRQVWATHRGKISPGCTRLKLVRGWESSRVGHPAQKYYW